MLCGIEKQNKSKRRVEPQCLHRFVYCVLFPLYSYNEMEYEKLEHLN